MTEANEHISGVLGNGRLQISFHWHRDRIAHTIGIFADERFVPVLASMEGSGEEPWPSSPPLQALEVESSDDGQIAMLVGMAGRSHWSVAVELNSASSTLSFDVACRLKDEPASGVESDQAHNMPGSAYRTMFDPDYPKGAPNQLLVGDVIVEASNGTAIRNQSDGFSLAAIDECHEIPRTVRWLYSVKPMAG